MKYLLVILLFISSLSVIAQSGNDVPSRFDLRLGVGTSLLGSGDMWTFMSETELNAKLNNYLATGISIGFGQSSKGIFEQASFAQGNLNFLVSPFTNTKRNDFRIGTGVSIYRVNDVFRSSTFTVEDVRVENYIFDERSSLGGNIIIENTYSVTPRVLIGVKVFTQPYLNGDINSGIQLRVGARL